jgi:hypothetical protein
MVHVHQEPVSQTKQIDCDRPYIFLNKSKGLDHVSLSKQLPDAWDFQVHAQIRNNQLPVM